MFGLGKKNNLFDLNILTSEFGQNREQIIATRIRQGFEIDSYYSAHKVSTRINFAGFYKFVILQNELDNSGKSRICELSVFSNSDFEKLKSFIEKYSSEKRYYFKESMREYIWNGWMLPNEDILQSWTKATSYYQSKIFSNNQVRNKD